MRPTLIILHPRSRNEPTEDLVARLAELENCSDFSFELVLIEYPRSHLDRNLLRKTLKFDEEGRERLSFVETESDDPETLTDATNKGLRLAAQAKLDAIIVGPDILPEREAVLELCAVSKPDPMVGFVEAYVTAKCDKPFGHREGGKLSASLDQRIFRELPRLSYVPIVDERFVLIRWRMLQEFGLLDSTFGSFACAMVDFALRANRCGYRVVQANHAQVARACQNTQGWAGETAPTTERDGEILRSRYPYLAGEISRYRNSPDRIARETTVGPSSRCRRRSEDCLCVQ